MIFNSKKPALHTGCQYDISSNRLFIHLRSGKHGWLIKSLLEVFFSLGESLKKNWFDSNYQFSTFPKKIQFISNFGWFPIANWLISNFWQTSGMITRGYPPTSAKHRPVRSTDPAASTLPEVLWSWPTCTELRGQRDRSNGGFRRGWMACS